MATVPLPSSPSGRFPLPEGVTVQQLERLCVAFATEASRFIRDERPAGMGVAATKSTETDVVTVMDRRSEELLHRLIRAARPDDGILGEEGADVTGSSGLTWVIDPIDGTVNYLYEIPAYAVSVAVVVGDTQVEGGWSPVAGAVADPCRALVHHAAPGTGALTSPEDPDGAAPTRRSRPAPHAHRGPGRAPPTPPLRVLRGPPGPPPAGHGLRLRRPGAGQAG